MGDWAILAGRWGEAHAGEEEEIVPADAGDNDQALHTGEGNQELPGRG